MSIEDRLRSGADEARRIAASFNVPGVADRSTVGSRRLAATVATGIVIAAVVAAGVWATSWVLNEDDDIADVPSPNLEWQQADVPPPVVTVADLWADDGGFNLWSGTEVWTSADGSVWELAITTPADIGGTARRGSIVRFRDVWIGIGNTDLGPTVYRNDGEWTSTSLPTPAQDGNPLLITNIETASVSSSGKGIVIAGNSATWPDVDLVMAEYAPELATSGGTARLNWTDPSIEIRDSDGTVQLTVPVADIDPRLSEGPLLETLVWHSPDGLSWQQIRLGQSGYAFSLDSSAHGYLLAESSLGRPTRIWESVDGIDWSLFGQIPSLGISDPAVFDGRLIATQFASELVSIRSGEEIEVISKGSALSELEQNLSLGAVEAGGFGIVTSAFNSSTEDVPVVAMWYSPNGEQWARYNLLEIFGAEGSILVAVGQDRVVVAHDPDGSAYMSLETPFQLWIGTNS